MNQRECTCCKQIKPLDMFANRKTGKFGKKPICKACGAQQTREWTAKNKDRKRATDAAYAAANKERIKKRLDQWRAENPDYMRNYHKDNFERFRPERLIRQREIRAKDPAKANASSAESKRKRPGYVNACGAARKARVLQATPVWADHDAIRNIYAEAARLTAETGIKHHVDHIYPLKSAVMCGLHVHTNLQILPWRENLSKSNLIWPEPDLSWVGRIDINKINR